MKRFLLSIFLLLSFFATSLFAVTSELAKNDDEVSKADPNRSFETYTIAELREYIAKLPQTESDPEVLEFEKLALSSDEYLRPLEMSLYYQGWNKDVFYQFGNRENFTFFNLKQFSPYWENIQTMPTNRQIRTGKGEIRNAQKAFLYAVLSKTVNDFTGNEYFVHPVSNLSCLYFEGIGTPKNHERIQQLYKKYIAEKKEENLLQQAPNFAIFYYLKAKNKAEVKENKLNAAIASYWRNFYCGFFVPQDKTLMFQSLEQANFNAELVEIYSGKYSANDSNDAKKLQYEIPFKKFVEEETNKEYFWTNETTLGAERIKVHKYMPNFPYPIFNKRYDKKVAQNYFLKLARESQGDVFKFAKSIYPFIKRSFMRESVFANLEEILPELKALTIFSECDFQKLECDIKKLSQRYKSFNEKYY